MVNLTAVQDRNYKNARIIYDNWYEKAKTGYKREDGWVRLVAALDTESGNRILAHTGEWKGGGRINSDQKAILKESARLYREATGMEPDGFGSNGGSVGPLQQIPTPVARLATEGGVDGGRSKAWDGWGGIVECMVLDTSIPKFLKQLRVTNSNVYKGKVIGGGPVAKDLLDVQQPLASEVDANYGASLISRWQSIATMYPNVVAIPAVQPTFIDKLLKRN